MEQEQLYIKKSQVQISKMKSIVIDVINLTDGINITPDTAGKRTGESTEEYFWTVVLEKTLESPLDCKEIQPVHPKGDQSWGFIGRTDAEAETPILWPAHAKSWLIGKDPEAGRDWGQEEKGTTEDEMAGWHHQFNGHEFE